MRIIHHEHYQKPVLEFCIVSKSIFRKHKKFSYLHNFGRIVLVNKLVLTFSASINHAKAQPNLIILSRVVEYTTYRQTDTFVKTVFSDSGVSKRKDLMKISKVILHLKLIHWHIMRL